MKQIIALICVISSLLVGCGGSDRPTSFPHIATPGGDAAETTSSTSGQDGGSTQQTPGVSPVPVVSSPTASPTPTPTPTPESTPLVTATPAPMATPAATGVPAASNASPPRFYPEPTAAPGLSAAPVDLENHMFYFSYDDSASNAARDLSLFALDNGRLPEQSWGRAFEFLNAETLEHHAPISAGPFQVSYGLLKSPVADMPLAETATAYFNEFLSEKYADELSTINEVYTLGVNISGPTLTAENRPNIVLTVLVDISGSMSSRYASETRSDISSLIDVVKHGLSQLPETLKEGDIISIVTFDTTAEVLEEGIDFADEHYLSTISSLQTGGSTNLDAGIELAYIVANRNYDAGKSNRVIIITDAYANTGDVNVENIAANTTINGLEGIHFFGIGVGSSFNEAFLNELTDIGKGGYAALVTPEDSSRIFNDGFMRFIDSAVDNVKFKLAFPDSVYHIREASAAEQVSIDETEVQEINFSYNDSQFFLEKFFIDANEFNPADEFVLQINYDDQDDNAVEQRITFSVEEALGNYASQVRTGALITALADLIKGKVSCEQLINSGLFTEEQANPTFLSYKSHIDSYCFLAQ